LISTGPAFAAPVLAMNVPAGAGAVPFAMGSLPVGALGSTPQTVTFVPTTTLVPPTTTAPSTPPVTVTDTPTPVSTPPVFIPTPQPQPQPTNTFVPSQSVSGT